MATAIPNNCILALNGNLVCKNDRDTFDIWGEGVGWWAYGLSEERARKIAEMYPATGDVQLVQERCPMKVSDDCPGRFKCHGPVAWCATCGDVDLVCDDPACDVHLRGREREKIELAARFERDRAKSEFESSQRAWERAYRQVERYRTGIVVMVARGG